MASINRSAAPDTQVCNVRETLLGFERELKAASEQREVEWPAALIGAVMIRRYRRDHTLKCDSCMQRELLEAAA